MKRREFIRGIVGSATAWPLAARALQPKVPVVGLLSPRSAGDSVLLEASLRKGLSDADQVDGRDILIVHQWANGQIDQLPALATELIEKHAAAIIVADGKTATLAAKAATSTIPIVFIIGSHPITNGPLATFLQPESDIYQPRSNLTGVSLYNYECERRLFASLCEMAPKRTKISVMRSGVQVFPSNKICIGEAPSVASQWLRREHPGLCARTEWQIDHAFITVDHLKLRVIFYGPGRFCVQGDQPPTLREYIGALAEEFLTAAMRHALPGINDWRMPVQSC